MIKTNYYLKKINKLLRHKYFFEFFLVSIIVYIFYNSYSDIIGLISVNIKQELINDKILEIIINKNLFKISDFVIDVNVIKLIINSSLFVVLFALFTNIRNRFFNRTKIKEIKEYDVKVKKYPYDYKKYEKIVGLVHDELETGLVSSPYYEKIIGKGNNQNIIITGSIGQGKTSRVFLVLLEQDIYYKHNIDNEKKFIMVLDVKGNLCDFVLPIIEKVNRLDDVFIIELGGELKTNLICNDELSPDEIAARCREVLEMNSSKNPNEDFWIEVAETLLAQIFKILKIKNNGYYTFEDVYAFFTKDNKIEKYLASLLDGLKSNTYSEDDEHDIKTASRYILEFFKVDERGREYIKQEISRMVYPFISNKKIKDMFCPKKEEINFTSFKDAVEKGKIVLFKMNSNKEKKLVRLAAAFFKLYAQRDILSTLADYPENSVIRKRKKEIYSDEGQVYLTSSDAYFNTLARETNTCVTFATQDYSQIKDALHGNEPKTQKYLNTFTNKIILRTDDVYTIDKLTKQFGKIKKPTISYTVSEAGKSNMDYNIGNVKTRGSNKNLSRGYSISERLIDRFDSSFFSSKLKLGLGICVVSDGESTTAGKVVHLDAIYEKCLTIKNGKVKRTNKPDKITITKDVERLDNTIVNIPKSDSLIGLKNNDHNINIKVEDKEVLSFNYDKDEPTEKKEKELEKNNIAPDIEGNFFLDD
jgi:hypothetical protein